MKNVKTFTVVALTAIALCACSTPKKESNNDSKKDETEETVGMINPWTDYENREAAKNGIGFDITTDENIISKYGKAAYRGMGNDICEISLDGMTIRKGVKNIENLSGDYTVYEKVTEEENNGITYKVSVNGDKAYVVEWSEGEYQYAVVNTAGMATADIIAIANATH